jgi:hypothetical protein
MTEHKEVNNMFVFEIPMLEKHKWRREGIQTSTSSIFQDRFSLISDHLERGIPP